MQTKPFSFGFFKDANKYLFIMHSCEPVQRSQCISCLQHIFKTANIKAAVEEAVVFNGYHLELFGFRPNPGPVLPKKVEPEVELDEEEQNKLWEELLPSDEETPICMADVDKAFQEALGKKEEMVLALRRPPASSASSSTQGFAIPQSNAETRVIWCTEPPSQLEVAMQRRLREWQKLEWVLFRCESEEMRIRPSLTQFADFYSIYRIFSTVDNEVDLQKQAFNTFAEHVKKTTGAIVERRGLPAETVHAVRRLQNGSIPGKHCQTCNRTLSDELEMDIDGNMIPKHRHGMFCSSECARGRCKGCSFELDEQKQCVKRCGIRPRAVVRRASWREYFEHWPKLNPDSTAWCKERLRTSTEEFLNSTMDFVTYGGFYQITPDARF